MDASTRNAVVTRDCETRKVGAQYSWYLAATSVPRQAVIQVTRKVRPLRPSDSGVAETQQLRVWAAIVIFPLARHTDR